MTQYPTRPHYPVTAPTSPCHQLVRSARLGSDKYQFYESLPWHSCYSKSWSSTPKAYTLSIQLPRHVSHSYWTRHSTCHRLKTLRTAPLGHQSGSSGTLWMAPLDDIHLTVSSKAFGKCLIFSYEGTHWADNSWDKTHSGSIWSKAPLKRDILHIWRALPSK